MPQRRKENRLRLSRIDKSPRAVTTGHLEIEVVGRNGLVRIGEIQHRHEPGNRIRVKWAQSDELHAGSA